MRWLAFLGALILLAAAFLAFFTVGTPFRAAVTPTREVEPAPAPSSRDAFKNPQAAAPEREAAIGGAGSRSARRVSGRVSVPDGFSLDDVSVALVLLDGMGAPEDTVDVAQPAADGSFELAADEDGEHSVVAFVRTEPQQCRKLLRPAWLELVVGDNDSSLQEPLALSEREPISGRLVLDNGPIPFPTTLSARPKVLVYGERVGPLVWTNGKTFEYESVCAKLDDAGAFRLTGLGPVEYELSYWLERNEDLAVNWAGLVRKQYMQVAPTEGAVLSLGFGMLLCEVRSAGQPLEGARVLVTKSGSSEGRMLERGHRIAILFTEQDTELDLLFEKQGYARRALTPDPRTYTTDQWLVVEMDAVSMASLDLVLSGVEVHQVTVTLQPVEGDPPPGFVTDYFKTLQSRRIAVADGHALVPEIAPGSYSIRVEAADALRGDLDLGWVLPTRFEAQFAPGEARAARIELVQGGRLEIPSIEGWAHALDPRQSVQYQLLDAVGTPLQMEAMEFYSESGVGRSQGHLPTTVTCELFPTLPPGAYTLEIFQGDPTDVPQYSFPVKLEAGKKTTLDVK